MGDGPSAYEITVVINKDGNQERIDYFVITDILPVAINHVLDKVEEMKKNCLGEIKFEGFFRVTPYSGYILQPKQ